MQDGPISTKLFNFMIYMVVSHWLMIVEDYYAVPELFDHAVQRMV